MGQHDHNGHHGHKSYHGHHGHQGHQGHNAISVIMFISILTHQSHINKVGETSFIHITSRASCDAKKKSSKIVEQCQNSNKSQISLNGSIWSTVSVTVSRKIIVIAILLRPDSYTTLVTKRQTPGPMFYLKLLIEKVEPAF